MSLTPEVTSYSKTRISPCGSGINKSLLTPCRRVGLSRKIKTPGSIVKMGPEDLNNSSSSIKDCSLVETTPVNHRKSLNSRKSKSLNFHETSVTVESESEKESKVKPKKQLEYVDNLEENRAKKYLFQSILSESLFSSQEDTASEKDVELIDVENSNLVGNSVDVNIMVDKEDFSNDTENNVNKIKMCSKRSVRRLSSDDDFNFDKQIDNDSEDDFKISSNKPKRKQHEKEQTKKVNKYKRIKKTLSIIKSTSISDDEFVEKPKKLSAEVKECNVKIHRLSEEEICLSESKTCVSEKPNIKTVVKQNVIDDDEDAFTSTPEQEKNVKKNLIQQIKVLEAQVKRKRQHLANLKQAMVYKNKHNVEELQQLTSKWMKGCADGLNGLLDQLKAHGPMNIRTLVNNLQIPSEIVAKLPLNFSS